MTNRHRVAYVLIGLGTVTLLARLSDGAGWLWIGLVAAAMLFGYARQRTYGLLVLGGILAGTAVGILLQEAFRAEALFLVSLGAGIAAIDLVEPRSNRWPRTLGAVLAAIGVVIGLAQSGAFASVWFALLLIAVGIAIIARGSGYSSFPPPRTSSGTRSPAPDAGAASPNAPSAAPGGGQGTVAPGTDVAARRASLGAWRERTAALEARSPQSILSDDVLDELAVRSPHDLNTLADVRGIGPVKLERYGDALLEAIRMHSS